jgi:hypothetical protein
MRPAGQPPAFGAQFMQSLNPTGQAVYTAMTGIQQVISDYQNRQDQREHSEAENIASNLTQAVNTANQTGDWSRVEAIMDDPHAMKVINKVFKGWLQQDKEAQSAQAKKSQQKPEKPDPTQQGFQSGVAKTTLQSQAPPGATPGTPQGTPPGSAPRSVGGYYLPQASPSDARAQQLKDQTIANQLRVQQEVAKQPVQIYTPEEQAKIATAQAEVQKANVGLEEAQVNLQKADIDRRKAEAEAQAAETRAKLVPEELKARIEVARTNSTRAYYSALAAQASAQGARYRAEALKNKGNLTFTQRKQVTSAQEALSMIDRITKTGGLPTDTLTTLKGYLGDAGLSQAQKDIQEGNLTKGTQTWWDKKLGKPGVMTPGYKSTKEDLLKIRPVVEAFVKSAQGAAPEPGSPVAEMDKVPEAVPVDTGGDIVDISPEELSGGPATPK